MAFTTTAWPLLSAVHEKARSFLYPHVVSPVVLGNRGTPVFGVWPRNGPAASWAGLCTATGLSRQTAAPFTSSCETPTAAACPPRHGCFRAVQKAVPTTTRGVTFHLINLRITTRVLPIHRTKPVPPCQQPANARMRCIVGMLYTLFSPVSSGGKLGEVKCCTVAENSKGRIRAYRG
jgi:hypothetical protein